MADVNEPHHPKPDDPALDFLSPEFDSKKALNTPGLEPPDPTAKPMDYVGKCRQLLPPEVPESLANLQKKVANEATKQKHEALKDRAMRAFQRIEESCTVSLESVMSMVTEDSPLSCLKSWHAQGQRIRVVTRHAAGVRGIAEGTLVAYDQFMNIILRDVTEKYSVMMRVRKVKDDAGNWVVQPKPEPGAAPPVPDQKVKWCRKQDHRQRQLNQILIKGDNIVSVSCATSLPQRDDVLHKQRTPNADSEG